GDTNGYSISSAGDVNGDGLDDLIVGIYAEGSTGKENSGKSFVVFGKVDGAAVDLSNIDPASGVGTGGFVINGEKIGDLSGYSVSSAGDVNGDGLDDLIIGGMMTSEPKDHQLSKIFVAFGKKNSTSAIDLSVIDKGVGGFTIIG
ncbi:integrin alpha, partial [Bathymodiolus thermophilus thioautotrophic gill symbiont]